MPEGAGVGREENVILAGWREGLGGGWDGRGRPRRGGTVRQSSEWGFPPSRARARARPGREPGFSRTGPGGRRGAEHRSEEAGRRGGSGGGAGGVN